VLAGQPAHERTLAHGGKSNETNAGHTGSGNIETNTCTTAAAAGLEQLSLELRKLGLELS
jgi:hypothetical protein